MSQLSNLLEGVEVERKPFGEVGDLVRGNGLPKSRWLMYDSFQALVLPKQSVSAGI